MNDQEKHEWLKERQTGIGGSDASVILGVNPFRTRTELWEEKISPTIKDIIASPPMLRGKVLEPVAADLYVQKTGRKIRRQPMRRHPEHEFMIGNVDRQILVSHAIEIPSPDRYVEIIPVDSIVGDVKSTGILEIKCPGLRVMANVKAHGLSDYMIVQLMHYLGVYDYEWGSFCLFNAENWDVIYFDLEADPEFIGAITEMESEFWNDYVLTGTPPPEDDQPLIDIPEVEGELKVIDVDDWRSAAEELQEAQGLRKAAAELEDTAKGTLKELMEVNGLDAVEIPDLARLYYRFSQGRTSWKKTAEAIAKDADVAIDDFKVEGKPYRTFKPYFLRTEEEA